MNNLIDFILYTDPFNAVSTVQNRTHTVHTELL